MNDFVMFRDEKDQKKLMEWWSQLQANRAFRAELRRAEGPEDVLLTTGFRSLLLLLSGSFWSKEQNVLGIAAVAGIAAYIEKNADISFAASCAAKEGGRPVVSEARFSQLQKSQTLDELFTMMRRIVQQLGKKAKVLSVADDILHWYVEKIRGEQDSDPRNHIRVRWGLDYFQASNIAPNKP